MKVIGIIPKKVASKNFILFAPKLDAIRVWIIKGIPGNNLKINKKLNSFFLIVTFMYLVSCGQNKKMTKK